VKQFLFLIILVEAGTFCGSKKFKDMYQIEIQT
jgi:hypothetical protein